MSDNVWDYKSNVLKKSKNGRLLLLERLINYGIYRKDKKRIPLHKVKKNWSMLSLEPKRKKLFRHLIWGT